jgi:hypothetical protein
MMYVEYPGPKSPPKNWLCKANRLTEALKAAATQAERNQIIDFNAALWGEIKQWLEEFSAGKCWFSEAKDTFSHWQVEHFRPKKEAKSPLREGYWWFAFDYKNYRLCGSVGNAKKGSFFPLAHTSFIARGPGDDVDLENSVLLDPTVKADVILLTFVEGGRAAPAMPSGWDWERATISIERYKLNDHPPLSRARQQVWNECRSDADQGDILLKEQQISFSPVRREKFNSVVKRLTDRTRNSAPFSSVARAFVQQHPSDWVQRCIA